ncbi:hypothetical protein CO613_04190 [Lysobacteraceae bacterium NML07-0707]|nr:hypothetical protein CO613_04190 [Xanthomonadaceae bacterium NML07-0707]
MNQALFRQEALQAKRGSWLGSISLAQPLPLWVLTGFAALAALTIGLFLFFGSYTRRAQVSGHLVPSQGMAMILAPATGIISQMQVAECSYVARDQALLEADILGEQRLLRKPPRQAYISKVELPAR